MAEQKTFRTALNGFNREDVVRYIEYLNAQHAAEISRLNSELDFLRNNSENTAPEAPVDNDLVEQQAARIRELFDLSKAQEEQIAALNARLAQQQENGCAERTEAELEAYRRAERTERMAQERAEQMYRQANSILADASVKVDEAAALISQMSDKVMGELSELCNAVSGSKQALRDAAATLGTVCPGIEAE